MHQLLASEAPPTWREVRLTLLTNAIIVVTWCLLFYLDRIWTSTHV